MNAVQMSRMPFSFRAGWDELIRMHPSIARLFAWVVLPFSLLPPVMIYYAAAQNGTAFVPGVTTAQWHQAAAIFFVAELVTVPLVAWLIHLICQANEVQDASYYRCFTLAVIAPVPLWLSSLSLLVPNLVFAVLVGGAALFASFGLIYHGVYALFQLREPVKAFQMASVICGTGLLAWLLLMQIVLIH